MAGMARDGLLANIEPDRRKSLTDNYLERHQLRDTVDEGMEEQDLGIGIYTRKKDGLMVSRVVISTLIWTDNC